MGRSNYGVRRFLPSFLLSSDADSLLADFTTGKFVRELADASDAVWRVVFRDDKCVTLCRRNDRTLMDVRTFRPSEGELDGASTLRK
jgi:hypothetical protein